MQFSRLRSNPFFLLEVFLNFSSQLEIYLIPQALGALIYLGISELSISGIIAIWVHFIPVWNEELWTGIKIFVTPPTISQSPSPWNSIFIGEALKICLLDQTSNHQGSLLKGTSVTKGVSFYPTKISPQRSTGINFIFPITRTSSCL